MNATTSTYVTTLADPLSSVPAPTVGSCGTTTSSPFTGSPSTAQINGSGTATFNPGTYCGGIQLNGSGTANFTLGPTS